MGEISLPSGISTQLVNVNEIYGTVVGTTLSFDGTISGWYLPRIEETPRRRTVQYLRDDKKALLRYEEIDKKEGSHAHYEKNGYIVKVWIPESEMLTVEEFIPKTLEFKKKGNGIIKFLRKKEGKRV